MSEKRDRAVAQTRHGFKPRVGFVSFQGERPLRSFERPRDRAFVVIRHRLLAAS